MDIKVSVIMATWNKNVLLPNTLYSLMRQKTSFPFEVCIVDDHSDVDPEPIIREFIPDVKYKRLEKQVGFMFSQGYCLDLVADDTDIIVIQSDDIIYTEDSILEKLCQGVGTKIPTFTDIVNIAVKPDLYKNFDVEVGKLLPQWDMYANQQVNFTINGVTRSQSARFMGYGRSWLFFLGAIRKEDLELLDFRKNNCDAVIHKRMRQQKFDANVLTHLKGIHQHHIKISYPCPIVKECNVYCGRK